MTDLNDRLDAAIDALLAGQELPRDEDLGPLLAAGRLLMEAPVPSPPHRRARLQMNAVLNTQRQRRKSLWHEIQSLWQSIYWVPVVSLALILFIFFTQRSLPGQPLYRLKRLSETWTLALTPNPSIRSYYYLKLTQRRLDELERTVATGRPVGPELIQGYRQTWEQALAQPARNESLIQRTAQAQAVQLQALIPNLPLDLQPLAQTILAELKRWGQGALPPNEWPSPTPIITPSPTPTPMPLATATPAGGPPGSQPARAIPTPTPSPSGPAGSSTPVQTSHPPSPTATPTSTQRPSPPGNRWSLGRPWTSAGRASAR